MKKFLNLRLVVAVAMAGFALAASPAFADTLRPVVSAITPTDGTVNVSQTYSATVTDADGIDRCYFYVHSIRIGEMTVVGSTASMDYTFTVAGQHDVYALCYDNTQTFGVGAITFITVGGGTSDEANITMGDVLPDFATAGIPAPVHVDVSSDNPIASCTYSVSGGSSVDMAIDTVAGEATAMYTFAVAGDSLAYVLCEDTAGKFKASAFTTVVVAAGFPASESAEPGSLVKTACPDIVYVNDPCTTVYYYGFDGQRHPFPNEKTYFTWYANYDTLDIVSSGFMAALPIGERVTYKPGIRMVKFLTAPTVYFVDKNAVLRAVASEDVAYDYYGVAWNTMIDDVSDAFYADYTFGETVDSTDDYSPSEASSGSGIEDAW